MPPPPSSVGRVLPGLLLAMLLGALDQTIMAPALPAVAEDLGRLDQMPAVVISIWPRPQRSCRCTASWATASVESGPCLSRLRSSLSVRRCARWQPRWRC